MEKQYIVKNWCDSSTEPKLEFFHDAKSLLKYIDKHKGEKISIYECECIVDWS